MPPRQRCPASPPARTTSTHAAMQYAAWLCGSVLGQITMGLHHKLCHALGGSFNLPHAEVHTVILQYALAYNASHAPEAMRRIARALGAGDGSARDASAASRVFDLSHAHGARAPCATMGCWPMVSTGPPAWPCRSPTRIRARSSARPSASCSSRHSTERGPTVDRTKA